MGKKTKPLNILYIDDEKEDHERLQMAANDYRIKLTHETNLEEGIKTFNEKKGEIFFDGIILDALCLIKKEDSIPNKKHIVTALKKFQVLAPSLPIVIFTGETAFACELTGLIEEAVNPIFNKGNSNDVRSMLSKFVDDSKHKEENIVARRYSDVFEIFDKGYLDIDAREKILDCIKRMTSNDNLEVIKTINLFRHLMEAVCKAINKVDNKMVPNDYVFVRKLGKDQEVDFRSIQWHLRGKFNDKTKKTEGEIYVPIGSIEDRISDLIYTVVSDYGSHDTVKQVPEYVLPILTYAMLNHLLWFKKVYQEKTSIF